MKWLLNEFESAFWVIVGVIFLGVGMWLSDLFTESIDKLWKKKEPD